MRSRLLLPALALVLAVVGLSLACDKATPVAPEGTVLLISANPAQIGLNGTSTITIIGRKPDGNPLNPGTEIRLTTDRGTIEPAIALISNGQATATLRADGRAGIAKVTAATGSGMVMVTADVQIGETDETKPRLIINVNPGIIPIGGTAQVTITGRNSDGSPAVQRTVILTSTLGSFTNARPRTGNDGTATTTLEAGDQSGTAMVTAIMGSSDPVTAPVEIRDLTLVLSAVPASIRRPATDDESDKVTIALTARVTDFQRNPVKDITVTFVTTRGRLIPGVSIDTEDDGTATPTLEIKRADLNASDSSFQVTASIPSGGGDPISQTVTITVTQ